MGELVEFVNVDVLDGPHLLGQVLEHLTDVVGFCVGLNGKAE